jgi:hypothetical protein
MKRIPVFLVVAALVALFISACEGVANASASDGPSTGGSKQAMPVEFTGAIESINGNQLSINGQIITVGPDVLRDGPLNVGDTVKVEVEVQKDGSLVVSRIERLEPVSTPEVSETPESSSAGSGTNSNSTPEPGDDNSLDKTENKNEAFGKVTSISGDTIVIDGKTYQLTKDAEIKSQIQSGSSVKVHFVLNADGSMTITEIQVVDQTQVSDDGSGSGSNSTSSTSGQDDKSGSNSGSGAGGSGQDDKSGSNSGSGSGGGGHDDSSGSGSNSGGGSSDDSGSDS